MNGEPIRAIKLDQQIVFRCTPELAEALQRDADTNGRTVAQSVRFLLTAALTPNQENDTWSPGHDT